MAKYQHWYIRGWVYEDSLAKNGKVRRELKYRGEYYRPYLSEKQFRNLKLVYALLMAVTYVVYVWFSLGDALGGRVFYAGAGCVLAIIPLIFQGMGVFSLLGAPYRMPFRNYYAAVLRTKVASAFTAGLLGVSAVGEAVFMILHRNQANLVWLNEWIWLGGCLLCAVAGFVMFFFLHELHFDILPGEIDTSELKRRFKK